MYVNQVSTNFLKNQCALLEQKLGRKLITGSYAVHPVGNTVVVKIKPEEVSRLKGFEFPERIGSHPVKIVALESKNKSVHRG